MNSVARRALLLALFVGGTVAGAALVLRVAYSLQLKSGEEALLHYARRILHTEESTAAETRRVASLVAADNLPFCSDQELALMRSLVYDAAFVKDMGRVKDGMLFCTSALGRLARPVKEQPPSLSFQTPDGALHVDILAGQRLALAPRPNGIVVVANGVSAVLNPNFYSHFDDPPMHFSGLLFDRQHRAVMYAIGAPYTLPASDVLAQKLVERAGYIYQPVCSPAYAVCVVGVESKNDMLARRPLYLWGLACAGGLLGFSIVSSLLFFLRRARRLERRLRRAVRRGELCCAYQPIVDLESGSIVAAEALARWTDESGEPVPPLVFIPAAEAGGFIGEITRLMIDHVIHELGRLLVDPGFHVSINITPHDLSDPAFFAHLDQRIAQSGIRPGALAFELTERSRFDQEIALNGITRLRSTGHPVYIDDFGIGYSSLSYLKDLRVDAVKLDRVFTHTIGTEAVIASLLPQIIIMASQLGLPVVVEGVETPEQAGYIRTFGPGLLGQGWLFGRPVPAAEFKALLKKQTEAAPEAGGMAAHARN